MEMIFQIIKLNRFEAARLKSLLSETLAIPDLWRHVSPKDLASSGFFYIGPQDKVCCYVCNLVVSQWAQGDQAKEQHRLWNPKCSFLTGDRVDDNIPFGEEGSQGQHKYDSLSKKGRFLDFILNSLGVLYIEVKL